MSQISEILTALLAYGNRLPALMTQAEVVMAELQELIRIATPDAPLFKAAALPELSAEEEELMGKCEALLPMEARGAVGGRLQDFVAFLMANPQLLAFFLSFLKK